MTEVQSVVGLGAFLPCNIQPIDTGVYTSVGKNMVKFAIFHNPMPNLVTLGPLIQECNNFRL